MLSNKKILLGVTGGIAAYKAIELASQLSRAKSDVHVILTRAAQEFVTPASFSAITGNDTVTSLFNDKQTMTHIDLARDASAFLVAPATANIIAKMAMGMADDALTTTLLAVECPILLAPAMNENMWLNDATQNNVSTLRGRGIKFLGPELGLLACGDIGLGRMSEPDEIVKYIIDFFAKQTQMRGKKILVTAGGTVEHLDDIRFIGNRSTGRMGYALASAAESRGAEVTLVSGPSYLPPLPVEMIHVRTCEEMSEAVLDRFDHVDAVIMAAAVSDYRFAKIFHGKLKKQPNALTLTLEPTTDILLELGKRKKEQILIGFAAESDNVLVNAQKKFLTKNLDLIIANNISEPGSGFESDSNEATIISADSSIPLPLMSKQELAEIIIDQLAKYF